VTMQRTTTQAVRVRDDDVIKSLIDFDDALRLLLIIVVLAFL